MNDTTTTATEEAAMTTTTLTPAWCDRCFGVTNTSPEGLCCTCSQPKGTTTDRPDVVVGETRYWADEVATWEVAGR